MRKAGESSRNTKETRVSVSLNLSGGELSVDTGIGFFDHMLHALAFYAGFGPDASRCKGDLHVDGHHTVEDVGIVLGRRCERRWEISTGIRRFACSLCAHG